MATPSAVPPDGPPAVPAPEPAVGGAGLPIAMAAISVDGRCRERNPADVAIFGAERDRLSARFVDAEAGQAMLARAVADGSAEATLRLATGAGERLFRVSLWRQRGGERIRVLGAFAALGEERAAGSPAAGEPADGACAGCPERMAAGRAPLLAVRALRAPLRAAIGGAERLRDGLRAPGAEVPAGAARATSDLLAAGWRLARLADALLQEAETGAPPPRALGEVDPVRLLRRILSLLAPEIAARGVEIGEGGLAFGRGGPLLLADESTLWTALEALLLDSAARAGSGGGLAVTMEPAQAGEGLAFEIAVSAEPGEGRAPPEPAATGPGGEPPAPAGPTAEPPLPRRDAGPEPEGPAAGGDVGWSLAAGLLARNGLSLAVLPDREAPETAYRLRIEAPAARCIDPA